MRVAALAVFLLLYRLDVVISSYGFPYSLGTNIEFTCDGLGSDWQVIGTTCVYSSESFKLAWNASQQFCLDAERFYSEVVTIDNWLLARFLRNKVSSALYWTGFVVINDHTLSVRSLYENRTIYNPLWAVGQPPPYYSPNLCVALNVNTDNSFGWVMRNCTSQLSVLCQTFACRSDEFRCHDNSRCIPVKALHDGITDCPDNSDESQSVVQKQSTHLNECGPTRLTSLQGEIYSPNFPSSYGSNLNCTWVIEPSNKNTIVLTSEGIALSNGDRLLIENRENSRILFDITDSRTPISFRTGSRNLLIRFQVSSRDSYPKGFKLKYHAFETYPCPTDGKTIQYDSRKLPYDCEYNLNAPDSGHFIYLIADSITLSEKAVASITSSTKNTFLFSSSNHSQSVVLPGAAASLSIRDSWREGQALPSICVFRIFYISNDFSQVHIPARGLTLHWPATIEEFSPHKLKIFIDATDTYTWSIDRVKLNWSDSIKLTTGTDVSAVISSGMTSYRGKGLTALDIQQTSSKFSLSIKFSIDCANVQSNALKSNSQSALGSCIRFSCPENNKLVGSSEIVCMMAGQWSNPPAMCSEMTSNCTIPIILNGFIIRTSVTQLEYGCKEGYIVNATSTIECSSSGRWTPQPVCLKLHCSELSQVYRNAILVNSTLGNNFGSVARYNPLPSMIYFPTLAQRYCISNQEQSATATWKDVGFSFREISCQTFYLDYGYFAKTLMNSGEVSDIVCMEGFSNHDLVSCLNGSLSNYDVKCQNQTTFSYVCENGRVVELNGGYTCDCFAGFTLYDGTEPTCKDINECEYSFLNLCDEDATCYNTFGSYQCICPEGKYLWMGESLGYSVQAIPTFSCLFKLCKLSDLAMSDYNFHGETKEYYRNQETLDVYCSLYDSSADMVFTQTIATCKQGFWDLPSYPCNATCSAANGYDYDSASNTISFFDSINIECSSGTLKIGSGNLFCGFSDVLKTYPLCAEYRCPSLIEMAKDNNWTFVSTNSQDPFALNATLTITFNDNSCVPNTLTCTMENQEYPTWSGTIRCKKQRTAMQVFDLFDPSVSWTFSRDWRYDQPDNMYFVNSAAAFTFLTSMPIALFSDSVKLVLEVPYLIGSVHVFMHTSNVPSDPMFNQYKLIGTTSSAGELDILLDNLDAYLSISIRVSQSARLSSLSLIYTLCTSVELIGITLPKQYCGSTAHPYSVPCPNAGYGSLSASCTSQGWFFSNTCGESSQDLVENFATTTPDYSPSCQINSCPWGTCVNRKNQHFVCECYEGFFFNTTLSRCMPDEKKFSFCSTSGTDEEDNAGFCRCKPGYYGDVCTYPHMASVTDCTADHSKNEICVPMIKYEDDTIVSTCVVMVGRVLTLCSEKPDNISTCPCVSQQGVCSSDFGMNPACLCAPGFVGQTCGVSTVCFDDYSSNTMMCKNGGSCLIDGTGENQKAHCNCTEHWSGKSCEELTYLQNCDHISCSEHGDCQSYVNGYFCKCHAGYSGTNCEIIDETICSPEHSPCYNGKCLLGETGDWSCNCTDGYSGYYCDIPPTLCAPNPCKNGTCIDVGGGSFICECFENYHLGSDEKCSELIEYCPFNPCLNNGKCHEKNGEGYSCECPTGVHGTNCEFDKCSDYSCENGGFCNVDDQFNPYCVCGEKFSGKHCENPVDFCDNVDCNHGSCQSDSNGFNCTCSNGFTGMYCDSPLNPCVSWQCEHGNCLYSDVNSQGYCVCAANYTGVHCETHFNPCDQFACLHGTCLSVENTPTCTCQDGYSGDHCDITQVSCDRVECKNGGHCVTQNNTASCICPDQFTGEFCQTDVSTSFNLVYNNLKSTQSIVSRMLNTSLYREFTLCGWVQYAPSKMSRSTDYLSAFVAISTNTNPPQYAIQIDNQGVLLDRERFISQSITTLVWHQICLRSPEYNSDDKYIWSYFVDGSLVKEAANNILPESKLFQYMIQLDPYGTFEGIISVVQMYSSRLNETEIAEMTFECTKWNTGHPDLIINWANFTTVSRENPAIKTVVPGICSTSNCLPGRPGCNDTDKIPPVVVDCPTDMRIISKNRHAVVEWPTLSMFYDNVGVTSITSNFRSGQLFKWGFYHVIYIASDGAGNTAVCEFDLAISPMDCRQTDDSQIQGHVLKQVINGTNSGHAAFIACDDVFYTTNSPSFFTCDDMGQWDHNDIVNPNSKYSFPSCGNTVVPQQTINGSLDAEGSCDEVFEQLYATIYGDVSSYCTDNCTDQIVIEPICNISLHRPHREKREAATQSFTYSIYLNTTRKMLSDPVDRSIKQRFPNGSSTVDAQFNCSDTHPMASITGDNFSCANCAPGTYLYRITMECWDCPLDTYRNASSNKLEECDPCPDGLTTGSRIRSTEYNQCYEKCPIGSYYANLTVGCLQCPFGTFQPDEGTDECLSCPMYTSTPITGATKQEDCTLTCSPGYEFDLDGVYCQPCPLGTYKNITLGPCLSCPIGLSTRTKASKYIADCDIPWCPPNTIIAPDIQYPVGPTTAFAAICNACEQGTYQPNFNMTSCIICPSVDTAPTCRVTSSCSPQLSVSCDPGHSCQELSGYNGIFSCFPTIQPVKKSHSPVIWIVIGISAVIVLILLGIVLYFYRDKLPLGPYTRKRDEREQNIYRTPIRNQRNSRHFNQPDSQNRGYLNDIDTKSEASNVSNDLIVQPIRIQRPSSQLPPPIITSRYILDKMEQEYTDKNYAVDPHLQDSFSPTGLYRTSFSSNLADDDDDFFG